MILMGCSLLALALLVVFWAVRHADKTLPDLAEQRVTGDQ